MIVLNECLVPNSMHLHDLSLLFDIDQLELRLLSSFSSFEENCNQKESRKCISSEISRFLFA